MKFVSGELMSGGAHAMHNKGITVLDAPCDHVTSWWLRVTDAEEMPDRLSWRWYASSEYTNGI
jgi:hypothetical protein